MVDIAKVDCTAAKPAETMLSLSRVRLLYFGKTKSTSTVSFNVGVYKVHRLATYSEGHLYS